MPQGILADWLAEDHEVDPARVEIGWGHSLDDAHISRRLCTARAAGPTEEAPLLRAVVARLLQRFSAGNRRVKAARGGLPGARLRRVIEWIEDDPAAPATVEDLARVAKMSPFHFAHQFTASTGRSPYRFVVERRVARAVSLLRDPRLAVCDVAARCGFAHTSHLSRQLQRIIGQSPAQLRRTILS